MLKGGSFFALLPECDHLFWFPSLSPSHENPGQTRHATPRVNYTSGNVAGELAEKQLSHKNCRAGADKEQCTANQCYAANQIRPPGQPENISLA